MNIHALRQHTYGSLALAFRPPTSQQLQALTSPEVANLWLDAVGVLPATIASSGSRHLRLFLTEVSVEGPAVAAELLAVEHCRLFVGPGFLPSPPYGSVYLDGGQVMGPSTIDALSRYRAGGLEVTRAWSEPPDHVAIELELMAHLVAGYAAALASDEPREAQRLVRAQREFLRDHLGRWGPAFAEKLRGAASGHLYSFLGEFLPAWLAFDQDLMKAVEAAALREGETRCAWVS